jgi:hypothetical protein
MAMLPRFVVGGGVTLLLLCGTGSAQTIDSTGIDNWLTVSANVDGGGRWTELFRQDHHVVLAQWDARFEFWLPPARKILAWGPYARVAGIASTGGEPWENAWLARPGVGVQVFPALLLPFLNSGEKASIAGPLRLFAEYNLVNYWGEEAAFRPNRQRRVGLDYWKAMNVNDPRRRLWVESWNGLYWQSSNEFTDHYDSFIVANALRVGLRFRDRGWTSVLTPYLVGESSWTENARYYWENHLVGGFGLRAAPALGRSTGQGHSWISRLVVYAEYVDTLTYYRDIPGREVPRRDFRGGVSSSLGQWLR